MIYCSFDNLYVTYNSEYLGDVIDPYNPLNLPPKTIRMKFKQGFTPTLSTPPYYVGLILADSLTLVDAEENIWDITKNSTDWSFLIVGWRYEYQIALLEVLGANTSGVTNMFNMFDGNKLLTNVPLFDTSSVTNMHGMFMSCNGLTAIPDFNVQSVTDCGECFYNCYSVETGILDIYNKLSVLTLSDHWSCFYNCGSNTVNGAAELAQIPENWKTEY